ncbi:MAG: hypothetical protein Q9172_000595 [Xanthocarpia lactea]
MCGPDVSAEAAFPESHQGKIRVIEEGALGQRAPEINEDVKVEAKERILRATDIEDPSLNAQENLTRLVDQEVEPRLADNDSEDLLSFDDSLLAGGGDTRSTAPQPIIAQDEERTERWWLTKEERRRARQAGHTKLYRRRLRERDSGISGGFAAE